MKYPMGTKLADAADKKRIRARAMPIIGRVVDRVGG